MRGNVRSHNRRRGGRAGDGIGGRAARAGNVVHPKRIQTPPKAACVIVMVEQSICAVRPGPSMRQVRRLLCSTVWGWVMAASSVGWVARTSKARAAALQQLAPTAIAWAAVQRRESPS